MKKYILILCLSFVQLSFSQYKNLNQAINDAGKQRMLSQRMAKSYLMIASTIQVDKYKKELDESMAMFAESHQKLTAYFKENKAISNEIAKIDAFWLQFREVASSEEYSANKCEKIIDKANLLLKASQVVVATITEKEKTKIGDVIDKSGSLRMLSQRLTMYYVALHLELKDIDANKSLKKAIKLIDRRLGDLIAIKNFNTDAINTKLNRASIDWNFIKKKLELNDSSSPAIIAVTLNNFMLQLDEVTTLYSEINVI